MMNVNVAIENAKILLSASKKRNFVVAQVSPAVRVAIGEKIGLRRGEDGVGKVVAALSALGADAVVDTAVVFDALTIMKAQALCASKENGGTAYSSECSKWVAFAKEKYPQIAEGLLPSVTTVSAKLLKKYYASVYPEKKIRVIALEMGEGKKADAGVDVVLTLDELAALLAETGLNVRLMKKQALETPFGVASGAAYAAYASGGDAEAIARTLCSDKTPAALRKFEYCGFYDKKDLREAELVLDGKVWNFAVADTLEAAEAAIESGAAYDYMEVTACRGGFVGMGCNLSEEEGERTRRLRKLGLKYLDNSRAARSADACAAAERIVKAWKALVRSGEADEMDTIDEIVEDIDVEEIVEIAEEPVVEEVVETVEAVVEESPVEEVVEEVVEETPVEAVVEETPVEEVAEEVVEEAPVEETAEENSTEALEEIVEMVMENAVDMEEVVEDAIEDVAEDVAEEISEEIIEKVGEIIDEEVLEEKVEEIVEDKIEEIVEEKMDEIVETVVKEVAEEMTESDDSLQELIEDAVEDAIEDIVEQVQDEIVEEVVEEIVETAVEEEIVETVEEEVSAVEEAVEETPVEAVEETVEETPVEAVEETVEETPVEAVEETVEEAPVETVEEAVEEAPVETVEEAVEETPAETVEETVEETPAETVEEAVEEAPVEAVEEVVEEVAVTEEDVQEAIAHVEELLGVDEKDLTPAQKIARATYYRRLSTKERRKLKRMKRNSKK